VVRCLYTYSKHDVLSVQRPPWLHLNKLINMHMVLLYRMYKGVRLIVCPPRDPHAHLCTCIYVYSERAVANENSSTPRYTRL